MPSVPVANLNSYSAARDAAAYLADSVRGSTWDSLDPDSQARALLTSTRLLERQLWEGTPSAKRIVQSVVVTAGGTGYAKGAILTVTAAANRQARVEVLTVSAGVVATVALIDAGLYDADLTGAQATSSSGAGTGCTLTPTMGAQRLHFPASGVADARGLAVSDDLVPAQVEQACVELAFLLSQDPTLEGQGSTAQTSVKRVKAGSAEVENFAPGAFVPITRFPPEVMELIAQFLASSGSGLGSVAFGDGAESQFDDCDGSGLSQPLG